MVRTCRLFGIRWIWLLYGDKDPAQHRSQDKRRWWIDGGRPLPRSRSILTVTWSCTRARIWISVRLTTDRRAHRFRVRLCKTIVMCNGVMNVRWTSAWNRAQLNSGRYFPELYLNRLLRVDPTKRHYAARFPKHRRLSNTTQHLHGYGLRHHALQTILYYTNDGNGVSREGLYFSPRNVFTIQINYQ